MENQEIKNTEANQEQSFDYKRIEGVLIAVREKVKKRKGVIVSKKYIYTMIVGEENGELEKQPCYYEFDLLEPIDLCFGARVCVVSTNKDISIELAEQLANKE